MGLSFKADIDDLRESPALDVVKELKNFNKADYLIVEPNIDKYKNYKLVNYENAFAQADIIVYLVAHREFKTLKKKNNKIELDFCGIREK